jgi:chromosome segregation ATPase
VGLKDLLGELLPEKQKDLQTSWRNAEEFFAERKASEIESAENRERRLVEETSDILGRLEEGLEAFDDYDDSRDLKIVEDVAQNFYRTRKRMIEEFEAPEDIEEHLEELEGFLEEFNDVSRKEGEVMKHIRKESPQLSEALEDLMEHKEKIERFVDTDYQVVVRQEMISDYVVDIEKLKQRLEETEKKLKGRDTREIERDIRSIEEKLDEIEKRGEWSEMKSLERELEQLKRSRKEKRRQIKSQISEMDRGLKKLTYNIENEGLEFKGSKKILEKLEERNIDSLDQVRPEIDKALELVEEEDLLEGRDLEKFRGGVEGLRSFRGMMDEIEELEKEIQDVKDRLSEFDLRQEKDELQERKDRLENDLEEKKENVRDLEEERNKAERNLHAKIMELERFMDSVMYHDIEIEEVEEDWKR